MGSLDSDELRVQVADYLRDHHTMTIATVGDRRASTPHAASVFYAVDDDLRLVFLSKPTACTGRTSEPPRRWRSP